MHWSAVHAVARPRGGAWGGLNPPTLLRGHSRDLHRTDEKILGYPPLPRNVVHANTLVLVRDVNKAGSLKAKAKSLKAKAKTKSLKAKAKAVKVLDAHQYFRCLI